MYKFDLASRRVGKVDVSYEWLDQAYDPLIIYQLGKCVYCAHRFVSGAEGYSPAKFQYA